MKVNLYAQERRLHITRIQGEFLDMMIAYCERNKIEFTAAEWMMVFHGMQEKIIREELKHEWNKGGMCQGAG